MTSRLELWQPGWDVEPCDTAPPPAPARHGNPYANAPTTPDADEQAFTDLHGRPVYIPGDHGRAPGRPTYWEKRRIHTIKPTGDLL